MAMRSAFNGTIDGIPDIFVDNFTDQSKSIYFLSHVHADHCVGLYKENYWLTSAATRKRFYMTRESQIIFNSKFWHREKQELVHVLEPGRAYPFHDFGFEVTLIPVKHMPGAVMFLFKVNNKNILYTGDFVIDSEDLPGITELHNNGQPITIDGLYYDATFCHINDLPKRSTCIESITNIISNWLNEPNKTPKKKVVAIFTNYKYGYEELLMNISNHLQVKIYVNDSNLLDVYRDIYRNQDVFTNGFSRIQLHITDRNEGASNFLHDNNYYTYLHVTVYAKGWRHSEPVRNTANNKYDLCYPTHCSKRQKDDFIRYFRVNLDSCTPFSTLN